MYHLGCPAWGLKSWVGRLFPPGTKQADYLSVYARAFDCVEGNTTFYAMPKKDNVARWAEQVPGTFRFCFKFPKKITHEKRLVDADEYVGWFLERLEPLGEKLGVLMLQLPPQFSPRSMDTLAAFLRGLSGDFRYAVELRHKGFFDGGDDDRRAADLLRELSIDTVIMDTRGLHLTTDPELAEVRKRKPKLPVVMRATGKHPIVQAHMPLSRATSRSATSRWSTTSFTVYMNSPPQIAGGSQSSGTCACPGKWSRRTTAYAATQSRRRLIGFRTAPD